jgi:hypothetical protein
MKTLLFVALIAVSAITQAQNNNCKKQTSCTGGTCQVITTCG